MRYTLIIFFVLKMTDSFETMLFNYETTNRTDFRFGQIEPVTKRLYSLKPTIRKTKPARLKECHTLSILQHNVPFDLFTKPKDVVRTNPKQVQLAHYEKPLDPEREQVQKTRPRLVMTPAVSLDDVTSPQTREILVRDIYMTTAREMQEEVFFPASTKQDPLGEPAPTNPVALPKWRPPYVSPEWRMESARWDGRQLRAHCDPDREFYRARHPKCYACTESAHLSQRK